MDKVQYIGPVEAMRGQTALMMTKTVGELVHEQGERNPKIVDKHKHVVQWDWPEGQRFNPKGEPVNAPMECFGWHEVDPTHWRKCHEIQAFDVI